MSASPAGSWVGRPLYRVHAMDTKQLLSDAAEVASFVKFLRKLCNGLRWKEVEPRAGQAWTERSPLRERLPWEHVRDFVRETWVLR